MELLNNIWVSLSTPNVSLLNYILIPAGVIESVLLLLLSTSILNISISKKHKILYIVILSIIGLLNRFIIPNPLNIILNYVAMFIMAMIFFKTSILKSCLSLLVSIGIVVLIGILITNPYLTMLDISAEQLQIIPIYRLAYMISIYILTIIIIFLVKNRGFKINIVDGLHGKHKKTLTINLIFGILTIIIQYVISIYYIDKLPIIITFLSFLSLLVYFALSIYSLTRVFKLTLTTQQLESAEEFNKTLHILHDNVRGFKHDFDNIVTTIGGYIKTNDMKGLQEYYNELEADCQKVNNLYLLNPEIINNPGIYNLLTSKYHKADSKNIKVNMTFLLDLSTLNMKIYEFARILGILLDNAIEASESCQEKVINLSFRNDTRNSRQVITIENTYNEPDIDIKNIFNKGISGKENHTGLGLWEIKEIIKKNNNVNLNTTKTDTYFTQEIEIF